MCYCALKREVPAPGALQAARLTIVEVAEVSRVEKKVCSEELSEAALAGPERQRGVQVQAAGPERLSAQVVA